MEDGISNNFDLQDCQNRRVNATEHGFQSNARRGRKLWFGQLELLSLEQTVFDCAAEKVAKDPVQRTRYPQLVKAVDEREHRYQEFLDRPTIRAKTNEGHLMVKWMDLDTSTERVVPHVHGEAKH